MRVCGCMLNCFSGVRLWETLGSSLPGSSLHGIFQARYWSGLPFPLPGDFADPEIKPVSLMSPALAGGFLTTSSTYQCYIKMPESTDLEKAQIRESLWVDRSGLCRGLQHMYTHVCTSAFLCSAEKNDQI